MKAKDLMEALKTFPEDMDVAMWRHDNYWESICGVNLIADAVILSCIKDDKKRKRKGKDIESFIGLTY